MTVTTTPSTPFDRIEALSFLGALVEDIKTPLSWRVFDDTKRTGYAKNYYGPFEQVVDQLLAEQRSGRGVFVVVNVTKPYGTEDLDVVAPRAVYIDMEGQPLPEEWALPPSLIVERDALHWHAYWMLEEGELIEQFRVAQERLIAYYGSDRRVKNESRVMRVPGFAHLKDPSHPRMYRVKHHAPNAVYTIDQVMEAHRVDPEALAERTASLPTGAEVIEPGGRHAALLSMAGWLRRHGRSEAQMLALLREFNREQCVPPKTDNEIADLARDMAKHDPDQGSTAMVEGLPERTILRTAGQVRPLVEATPFQWRDPIAIPPREWVYGTHLIRGFVSLITAPGGAGKTALSILDAISLATGRDLAGFRVHDGPKTVWLWNLEDPIEEIERRVAATIIHYGINPDELAGRLFIDSGRDNSLCIATAGRDGAVVRRPVVDALIAELGRRAIDVLMVDPFVSSHQVPENDNNGMDTVAKEWGRVAHRARCSIRLAHHVKKLGGGEATAESVRGGKALVDAARSTLVLNRMQADEAEKAGLETHLRHFKVYDDKNNLAPASERADWFRFVSVLLPNGDNVGVVEPWKWPDPMSDVSTADLDAVLVEVARGEWREDSRSEAWVGAAVAKAMRLDLDDLAGRTQIKSLIKTWITNKALVVVERRDAKRMLRKFVVPGQKPEAKA